MKYLKNKYSLILGLLVIGVMFININTARAQLKYGVKVGGSFANVNGVNYDRSARTGFLIGAYADFSLPNSPVVIQPELLYSQKGYKANNVSTFAGSYDITYKLDYLEVPVLAKLSFGNSGSLTPHVYAGPYLGFNITHKAEAQGKSSNISQNISSTDFGFVGGAGVTVSGFDIGARYEAGLSKLVKNSDGKNGAFMITVGYSL